MSEQSKHTDMKLKPANSRSLRPIIVTQSLNGAGLPTAFKKFDLLISENENSYYI